MPELACCRDKAAHHQLPIPAAFWIIGIVSMEKCSSLMQNLMQICCSTHTVILNVMATQYTCTIQWCLQHPLTSTVKSSLLMHAHSSPPSLATRFHWCCTIILVIWAWLDFFWTVLIHLWLCVCIYFTLCDTFLCFYGGSSDILESFLRVYLHKRVL